MNNPVNILSISFLELNEQQKNKKLELLKIEVLERLFEVNNENKYNPNCIDGRDDDIVRPSVAGGKFGVLAVLLSSLDSLNKGNYDREAAIASLKQYFQGCFGGHSDTHADTQGYGCECNGCGHVFRLLQQGTQRYELSKESIAAMQELINCEESCNIKILEGDHRERNVLVVGAPGYGIQSSYNGQQDFVYNAAYSENLYDEISELINTNTDKQTLKAKLLETNNLHLHQTAGDLAQGKDMFSVSDIVLDNSLRAIDCTLKYIQTIPKK